MSTLLIKCGRLEIYEAVNGFYIRDSLTNDTKGMGDGVDMYTDKDGHILLPSSKAFYAALRKDARYNKWQLMEAYFGVTRESAKQDFTKGVLGRQVKGSVLMARGWRFKTRPRSI